VIYYYSIIFFINSKNKKKFVRGEGLFRAVEDLLSKRVLIFIFHIIIHINISPLILVSSQLKQLLNMISDIC